LNRPETIKGAVTDRNVLHGILLMACAVSLFSILNAFGKHLSVEHAIIQIVWFRFAIGLVLMLVLFAPKRGLALVRAHRPGTQMIRALLLVTSSMLFFTGVSYLPLATATTISFTAPLIITALSVPFLGEQVGIRRWTAVAFGFVGALVIIRPGMEGTHWAAIFVVGSTTCSAFYQLLTRKLAGHDDPETSNFYTSLVGTVLASIAVLFVWQTPADLTTWTMFVALGILGGGGHYLLTRAYTLGPAATISPFNYLQLVGATVLGYTMFGHFPDFWTWVGAGIIVASGLYIAHREAIRRRQARTAAG